MVYKLKKAELRDGHYLLRSNLVSEDPAVLWDRYIQLTQIEAAFKALKSELGLRPIYHQLEHRVEAHILIAFLAYLAMFYAPLTSISESTSWFSSFSRSSRVPRRCTVSSCPSGRR